MSDGGSLDRSRLLLQVMAPPAPGERRRVLVVDDEPGMRYVARRVLSPRYEVLEAATAEDALRLLETETIHIAVVDVRLPGRSGLDLLSTIRTVDPAVDVIVMTGSAADPDEALEDAVRRQAFFFLRKPFPMQVLETLADRASERQELQERLLAHVYTLERDLAGARVFQEKLLPPRQWQGGRIRVSSLYQASERLSGDFFDYWHLSGGGTALFIADVMGHGASAAMATGIVKSQVRSLASEIRDPGEVLEALEEEISRIRLANFFTAFLVFDRPSQGEILFAGAGHPPAMILRGDGRMARLASSGIPLNTGLPLTPRTTEAIARDPGSRLLLYTDGYPEAANAKGERFEEVPGDGGFLPTAEAALRAQTPDQGARLLEEQWSAFTGGGPGDDDRAAVLAWME